MNVQELASRDIADLRKLAAQYGIKTHPKHKPETIAKLIVDHATQPVKQPEIHKAEVPKASPIVHTEDQVREAIKALLAKDGFTAEFPKDDTVILKYKGCEESIHLSSELRWIKIKAESVSRGMRKFRTAKNMDGNDVMMVG